MSTNSISAWVLGHGSDNLVRVLLQRCWILFAVCALMNGIEVLPQLVPAVAPLSILFGCGSAGILHKWLSLIQCWDPRGSCKQLPGALHLLWSWAGFSKICSLGFTGYCSAAALEFFPRPNSKTGLPTLINREQLNARSPCQMETFISNTSARGTRIAVWLKLIYAKQTALQVKWFPRKEVSQTWFILVETGKC